MKVGCVANGVSQARPFIPFFQDSRELAEPRVPLSVETQRAKAYNLGGDYCMRICRVGIMFMDILKMKDRVSLRVECEVV